MSLYNDNDVDRGSHAQIGMGEGVFLSESIVRNVLDAVLPEYLISLADEIEAKRPCKCNSCSAIKNLIREKAGE